MLSTKQGRIWYHFTTSLVWWSRGSNPQPPAHGANALPLSRCCGIKHTVPKRHILGWLTANSHTCFRGKVWMDTSCFTWPNQHTISGLARSVNHTEWSYEPYPFLFITTFNSKAMYTCLNEYKLVSQCREILLCLIWWVHVTSLVLSAITVCISVYININTLLWDANKSLEKIIIYNTT